MQNKICKENQKYNICKNGSAYTRTMLAKEEEHIYAKRPITQTYA
jgi:hypothetical protein